MHYSYLNSEVPETKKSRRNIVLGLLLTVAVVGTICFMSDDVSFCRTNLQTTSTTVISTKPAITTTSASSKANLLLHKPSRSSSCHTPYSCSFKGNNGIKSCGSWTGVPETNDLVHTGGGHQEWWTVDLGAPTYIKRVVTYQRGDAPQQLANYVIRIGNNYDHYTNPTCPGVYNQQQSIQCEMTGRYVTLHRNDGGHLVFCEVEAYNW